MRTHSSSRLPGLFIVLLCFVTVLGSDQYDENCNVPIEKRKSMCPDVNDGIACLEKKVSQTNDDIRKILLNERLRLLRNYKANCPALADKGKCYAPIWYNCKDNIRTLKEKGYHQACSKLQETIKCMKNVTTFCKTEKGSEWDKELDGVSEDLRLCQSGYFKDLLPFNNCQKKIKKCTKKLPERFTEENKKEKCPQVLPAAACVNTFRPKCEYRELKDKLQHVTSVPDECDDNHTNGVCSVKAVTECMTTLKKHTHTKHVCDKTFQAKYKVKI